jgi:hypothetical protein
LHRVPAVRRLFLVAALAACKSTPAPPPPDLTVVGESTRLRMEASRPERTAWFDGSRVSLAAARGETLGIQVVSREPRAASLQIDHATVAAFDVDSFVVKRPSTAMYGGSQGRGTYPDALRPAGATATTNPAYFEIAIARDTAPGTYAGELVVGARHVPVTLEVSSVVLPELTDRVWALYNPREIPVTTERACIAEFHRHGVLLSPDIHLDQWEARKDLLARHHDIPVWIPSEPTAAAEAVRAWIEKTRGTGMVPFSIPIDEPRTKDKQERLRAVANAVREAGGGPSSFRLAVTDDISPERYGDMIDLYISLYAKRTDTVERWTYNGAPPHAGSFLLDAATPGARTWGWIGWRWRIPTWYVWDALYWHDRHNRKGAPLPGKTLVPGVDPVSFDDGGDHGNFDGVLALPSADGCQPTLRLAAIRRGLQDRQLLELAATCDPAATEAVAARIVPRALGDAPKRSSRSWSADESDWERARRELVKLASSCHRESRR